MIFYWLIECIFYHLAWVVSGWFLKELKIIKKLNELYSSATIYNLCNSNVENKHLNIISILFCTIKKHSNIKYISLGDYNLFYLIWEKADILYTD